MVVVLTPVDVLLGECVGSVVRSIDGLEDGLDNGKWLGLLMSLVGSFIGWGVVGAYVHCTFMLKQSNTSVIGRNKKIIITARGRKQMHLFSPLLD